MKHIAAPEQFTERCLVYTCWCGGSFQPECPDDIKCDPERSLFGRVKKWNYHVQCPYCFRKTALDPCDESKLTPYTRTRAITEWLWRTRG